jgi:Tfp pilus assembly protein FimT
MAKTTSRSRKVKPARHSAGDSGHCCDIGIFSSGWIPVGDQANVNSVAADTESRSRPT